MASKRQNAANRRNARRSTGPRTEDGRRASSLNALKHGLRSPLTVIPGENEADFHSLFDAFADEAAPESARDFVAVRKAAACEWRLRRITAIETEMFIQALKAPAEEPTVDNIEAIVERLAAQQAAPPQSPYATLAARFLDGGMKHFNALARYEASLNRQYQQAWRELDNRPESGFREVYDPAGEPLPEPEPEPHYTEPTPEALQWKSALDRYADATQLDSGLAPPASGDSEPAAPDHPAANRTPDPAETPINSASPAPLPETAQSNPIPKSNTTALPFLRPPMKPFPPDNDVPGMIEWVRERGEVLKSLPGYENEDCGDEEEPLEPAA